MPIFLISGFDAITCIAAIYMGSSIGTMFSTVNPFSVVIASNAAGINFTSGLKFRIVVLIIGSIITLAYVYWYAKKVNQDPKNSLVYDESERIRERFLKDYDPDKVIEFTLRRKLIFLVFTVAFLILVWGVAVGGWWFEEMSALFKDYDPDKVIEFTLRRKLIFLVFTVAFLILVWGVAVGGWWFEEMSALFLGVAIIIMVLSGLSEKDAVNTFVDGAAELIGVVLTIGLARAINIVMDNVMISDTLLNYSINTITGMSGSLFAIAQLVVFSFLGFFIPSSSGLAVLTLGVAIIIMVLSGLSEKDAVNTFVAGAADLIGVVLTIGLARAINIVMDNGMISDTLLNYSINMITGMSGSLFAIAQLVVFSFLGFFIPSSSGLAVLTMPIMAPLADSVGLSREVVINAYNWGQGLMAFITPTGLILVTLEMAETTFNKWLKYIMPLMIIMGIYSVVALIIGTMI